MIKIKITRRIFIHSSILAGTALILLPKGSTREFSLKSFKIISYVQDIIFPKSHNIPSASEFGAINYLINVSLHPSFNNDDLLLLYQGAEKLIESYPNFVKVNLQEKSNIIDIFSKTQIGHNWLSLLLYYTIEALLSDPIYGGNRTQIGWRWLNHHTGVPRPKKPFGERV